MSAFNRKRKASPPDHVGQSKRWVLDGKDRMLCKCSVAIQLSCTGCGHASYINCPPEKPSISTSHSNFVENVREEHEQTLTPSPSLRPGFSDWQSLSQEFLTSGRDEELEMGQDVEESQAQELPLQPTEEQQPVETERPSKRSLNMNKCERCRQDKKKCLPVDRVWPAKCDLCIKKGFSCSESKRIFRSTKHAPATTPSPINTTSPSTTSASFEERLKQWTFLLSYRRMMTTAMNRLKELQTGMTSLFALPNHSPKGVKSRLYHYFSWFVEYSLAEVLSDSSKDLFTLETTSQTLPGWFLITSLNQYGGEKEFNFACSGCFSAQSRSRASEFEGSKDTCGELLSIQHRIKCPDDAEDDDDDGFWEAHSRLSHEVRKRAAEIFESHGSNEAAEWASSFGIYHPDGFGRYEFRATEDFRDCLERSQLHLRMDVEDDEVETFLALLLDRGPDVSELKDRQDVLGRTALITACEHNWDEAVEWLLREKADPGLATMYGSLPLHYAAVKGFINICKLLLAHSTRFDIKAKDCMGKTALDYAKEKNHHEIVDLLSVEYAASDRLLGELERARSLHTELENHEVQGSYFV